MRKRLNLEELFRQIVELVLREMSAYFRVERILATVETLADKEALRAIRKSREEVAKGEYVECSMEI